MLEAASGAVKPRDSAAGKGHEKERAAAVGYRAGGAMVNRRAAPAERFPWKIEAFRYFPR